MIFPSYKSFSSLFFFLIISAFGPFLGWILTNYTTVKRKIYIIFHFTLLTTLAFLMLFFKNIIQYLGGSFLFFCLSLIVLFIKFGWEIYSENLHKKIHILFSFTLFSFAFLTVLIITPLYFYRINACFISLIISSISGLGLSFFLDKDIN